MKIQVILAASLIAGVAFADRVTLKSGSFLTGKAGEISGDALKFASDDLGDIQIKVANIAKLESERTHVVKYLDGRTEEKAVTVADGAYVVGGDKLDMTNVKAIDPEPSKWHGSVNVAFNSDRGNSYGNSVSVLANLNRRWELDRLNFDLGYYYSKTGTSSDNAEKSKDRVEFEGQYDHFWTSLLYSYVNGRYDRDDIAGLDCRIKLGTGLGLQWLDGREFDLTGKWSFSQEFGAAYVHDDYKDRNPDRDENYATLRYAHHLTYVPKWVKGLDFFHNFEYLPDVSDFDIYLIKCDAGFSTTLFWNISLLGKFEWDYNSCPSGDRKSTDTRWILGLGYKW